MMNLEEVREVFSTHGMELTQSTFNTILTVNLVGCWYGIRPWASKEKEVSEICFHDYANNKSKSFKKIKDLKRHVKSKQNRLREKE